MGVHLLPRQKFHRDLLSLLGRSRHEVLDGHAPPDVAIPSENVADRLGWYERGWDEQGRFPMLFLARLFGGEVWAVGVQAPRYFFAVEYVEGENPYLVAVPKQTEDDPLAVNWIVHRDGGPANLGVGH